MRKIELNRKIFLKIQKLHILDPDSLLFDHYAKSRDITSQRPLFWRTFILPIFGPKLQAEATILQALKTAKIKAKMTMFLKLLGPCRKEK